MKLSFKTLGALMLAGTMTIVGCNSSSTSTENSDSSSTAMKDDSMKSSDTATTATAGTMDNSNPDQAAIDFLVPANMKEVDWVTAGINGGTSKDVKEHSKHMLADHKALGEKVKALITKKSWTMPAFDTTGAVNLTEAKGTAWDKAFADKMVEDHTMLLEKLNSFESSVKDADLKTLVTNTKPVVQSHLDMAKMLQGKMK